MTESVTSRRWQEGYRRGRDGHHCIATLAAASESYREGYAAGRDARRRSKSAKAQRHAAFDHLMRCTRSGCLYCNTAGRLAAA